MKKYLDKNQTETLYKLGFKHSDYITEFWKDNCVERRVTYSIGDLIEMFPQTIDGYELIITGNGISYAKTEEWNEIYDFYESEELIDNLYECLLKLKEDNKL